MTAPTFSADVEAASAQQLEDLRNSLTEALNDVTEQRTQRNRLYDELQLERQVREKTTADLNDIRTQLATEKATHAADVKLIGDTLIEATDEYDSRSLYDVDLVDRINYRLDVALPLRVRKYRVRINVEVDLGVEATSEESAKEAANADIREIESTIDNYSVNTAYSVVSTVAGNYDWDVNEDDDE